MAYLQKLLVDHRQFITKQVASCNTKVTLLAKMLGDESVADEYGFNPVSISHQAVSAFIGKIGKLAIGEMQADYLADFNANPLSHKLNRVKELEAMYWRSKFAEPKSRPAERHRREILRDIKAEIGEDVETIADALRVSGGTTIHVDLSEHQRREIAYVIMPQPVNGGDQPVVQGPTNGGAVQ